MSNRGGEYLSNEFNLFCMEHCIIHERTMPIHPNQTELPTCNITDVKLIICTQIIVVNLQIESKFSNSM
jgi:hypothetical protein